MPEGLTLCGNTDMVKYSGMVADKHGMKVRLFVGEAGRYYTDRKGME